MNTAPLILLLLGAPACAASLDIDPNLTLEPAPDSRAEIMPIVWWSSLAGDLTIAPGASFDIRNFNADEPTLAAGAEARIDARKLTFAVSGFHRSDSATNAGVTDPVTAGTLNIPRGGTANWDIDLTGATATAGYRFDPLVDDEDVTLSFDVYAGVRYLDLRIDIRSAGSGALFDEAWAMPIAGARLRLDLPYEFEALIELDAGYLPLGDTTLSSWEVFAGFSYHPTPNVGVRAGFRHLSIDYLDESGSGDNKFDGFLAGLYAGVVIRF